MDHPQAESLRSNRGARRTAPTITEPLLALEPPDGLNAFSEATVATGHLHLLPSAVFYDARGQRLRRVARSDFEWTLQVESAEDHSEYLRSAVREILGAVAATTRSELKTRIPPPLRNRPDTNDLIAAAVAEIKTFLRREPGLDFHAIANELSNLLAVPPSEDDFHPGATYGHFLTAIHHR